MKIGQPFNKLTFKEYFYYIPQHKKYTDFNTLGLYRSILENEKLSVEQKIEVRDYANQFFGKFFEFLQVKDPYTHRDLTFLGQDLPDWKKRELWMNFNTQKEKILSEKGIRHRNFGIYSVHDCGDPNCYKKGVMLRYENYHPQAPKSNARKADRKKSGLIIRETWEAEKEGE